MIAHFINPYFTSAAKEFTLIIVDDNNNIIERRDCSFDRNISDQSVHDYANMVVGVISRDRGLSISINETIIDTPPNI